MSTLAQLWAANQVALKLTNQKNGVQDFTRHYKSVPGIFCLVKAIVQGSHASRQVDPTNPAAIMLCLIAPRPFVLSRHVSQVLQHAACCTTIGASRHTDCSKVGWSGIWQCCLKLELALASTVTCDRNTTFSPIAHYYNDLDVSESTADKTEADQRNTRLEDSRVLIRRLGAVARTLSCDNRRGSRVRE
jgi:hypothetical protein